MLTPVSIPRAGREQNLDLATVTFGLIILFAIIEVRFHLPLDFRGDVDPLCSSA